MYLCTRRRVLLTASVQHVEAAAVSQKGMAPQERADATALEEAGTTTEPGTDEEGGEATEPDCDSPEEEEEVTAAWTAFNQHADGPTPNCEDPYPTEWTRHN